MSSPASANRRNFWRKRNDRKSSKVDKVPLEDDPSARLSDKLRRVRHELKKNYSHPEGSTGRDFITLPTVQTVIDRDCLREILQQCAWYNEDLLEVAWKRCLKVIATLITIEWPAWEEFKHRFLDDKDQSGPRHGDRFLPFTVEDLVFLEPAEYQTLF